HKAGDILQEDERNAALTHQLDEMRTLECAFRKQNAVIGKNANRITPNPGSPANERLAIELFELIELRAVNNPRDHLTHTIWPADIGLHDAIEFFAGIEGLARDGNVERSRFEPVQIRDNPPGDADRMSVALRIMVCHTGLAAVNLRPAQLLGGDNF